jgi:bacterioferritin-associated ferredoxin
MYVCLCNGLTDRQVAEAVADGAARPNQVHAKCGCRAQCGTCLRFMLETIRAAAIAAGPTAAAAAGLAAGD